MLFCGDKFLRVPFWNAQSRLCGWKGRFLNMTISLKHMGRRTGAVLVSLLLLLTLAVSASAAAVKMTVGVRFWRESGDKESMADSAVDTTREATLTRQPNGTFTLELPVKQLSSMNMTGCLTGIAIGEVNYDGTLSGDLSDGTAVLTLKNLPASVLTGSDSSKALAVTCSIKMDTILLGDISTSAKMSIWVER